MLAALGMFVFNTDSTLFDQLDRRRGWRHGRTDRFGALAASQYLGPGEDQITISGKLVPELVGSYSAIEKLVEMADTGEAYPLADGTGKLFGQFTIENIDEQHQQLIDTGQARQIDFRIELKRVA